MSQRLPTKLLLSLTFGQKKIIHLHFFLRGWDWVRENIFGEMTPPPLHPCGSATDSGGVQSVFPYTSRLENVAKLACYNHSRSPCAALSLPQDNLLGGQFWAMGRFNLLGGQSKLLGEQMPTLNPSFLLFTSLRHNIIMNSTNVRMWRYSYI